GGVVVGRASGAQRGGVRLAVFVEHFDVTQVDGFAGWRVAKAQPHPADHVLSEVEDVAALIGGNARRRDGFDLLGTPRRGRAVCDDLDAGIGEDGYGMPAHFPLSRYAG